MNSRSLCLNYLLRASLLGLLAFSLSCHRAAPGAIAGVWEAEVQGKSGQWAPFKLEIAPSPEGITGTIVNGDDRLASTSGSFDGEALRLRYDFYDGELVARLVDGALEGAFERQWRKETLRREVRARRAGPAAASSTTAAPGAEVGGEWVMRVGEGGQQRAWRAVLRQAGEMLSGTVIPLSGDWGEMTGRVASGELTLGRFDGINFRLVKARLTGAGQLEGTYDLGGAAGPLPFTAERAAATNLSELPDPTTFTRMKNPAEPFRFSFPDANGGAVVSSTDERFRDKVVIVTITGTWCPNCHDEAPFLEELYQRHRAQGLEVVGLAFEYTGEAARDSEQVRIFERRHQLTFPILLAGTTDEGEAARKLPQLENFSAYPTTLFIGRDGLVKRIHAGFEGRATGARYTQLRAEIEELVASLLNEQEP